MPAQDGRQYYAETMAVTLAYPGKPVQGFDQSDLVQVHRMGCWIGIPATPIDMNALSVVVAELARMIDPVLNLCAPGFDRREWSKIWAVAILQLPIQLERLCCLAYF